MKVSFIFQIWFTFFFTLDTYILFFFFFFWQQNTQEKHLKGEKKVAHDFNFQSVITEWLYCFKTQNEKNILYGDRRGRIFTLRWPGRRERHKESPSFQYFLKKHISNVLHPLAGVHVPYLPTIYIMNRWMDWSTGETIFMINNISVTGSSR